MPVQNLAKAEVEQLVSTKSALIRSITEEMHRVVIGQNKMIQRLLIGLFTNGHILLEGVPGLAKTLTVSTLASALQLSFKRIQFTPDLLPADLIGTLIYNQKEGRFEVKKGPIFANIILADEINRSPAKVQSALLEAMQEKQVTIGEHSYRLDKPFLVMATQNPIDQEGTYPLPEAQVDRFMMKVYVDYPSREEELAIMRLMAVTEPVEKPRPLLDAKQILEIQQLINHISFDKRLENYIVNLVIATRKPKQFGLEKLQSYIEFGASPRASISMHLAARAYALMQGRTYAQPEDVKEIAIDTLSHRILITYEAEADGITQRQCVQEILNKIEI